MQFFQYSDQGSIQRQCFHSELGASCLKHYCCDHQCETELVDRVGNVKEEIFADEKFRTFFVRKVKVLRLNLTNSAPSSVIDTEESRHNERTNLFLSHGVSRPSRS